MPWFRQILELGGYPLGFPASWVIEQERNETETGDGAEQQLQRYLIRKCALPKRDSEELGRRGAVAQGRPHPADWKLYWSSRWVACTFLFECAWCKGLRINLGDLHEAVCMQGFRDSTPHCCLMKVPR